MNGTVTRALLVALFVLCAVTAPVFAYENLSQFASARATNINADLQADYHMSDLDDIEAWYVDQQATWMQIALPGMDPWTQGSAPSQVPVSWSGLGSTFTSQLVPDPQYGVNVYPLTIKEDFTTHQVEFWVGSSCIHTMAFRSGYDWTMYTPPGGDTNMYNPARIVMAATLVKDNELYTYLYNEGFEVGATLAEAGEANEDLEDTDGDGYSNRDELRYGTDPYDPGDLPSITSVSHTGSTTHVEWAAPTNRWYQVQSITAPDGLVSGTFTDEGSLRMGNGTTLVHEDAASADNKFYQYKAEEADVNANGLPDWWEYKYWSSLTTNTPAGDNDADGLDNSEELYFGYSPLVSERDLIHSIYHTVIVATDAPRPDSGDERFDFHGGGRPLGLASGASDGFGVIQGDSHSGGIFFNNDEDNLYIGISGLNRDGNNAFVMFIDAKSGGVTNLAHLSGQPYAFGLANNFTFQSTNFLPEVGIILGGNYADGGNFPSYGMGSENFGQGVYNLADLSAFSGFRGANAAISQWAKNAGGAEATPKAGCEIQLSLSALGVQPGDTIKVAACFIGGTDNTNRWSSGEAYGKTFSGGGYGTTVFVGAPVQLAGAGQTLPNVAFPEPDPDAVIIQVFFWNAGSPGENPNAAGDGEWYDGLSSQVADISTSGFTHVYLPPPQKGESGGYSMGYDPFDQYDTGLYVQKTLPGVTDTRFGTHAELTNLVSLLLSAGVTPICDIVINHMRQASGGKTFTYVTHTGAPQFNKSPTDFHPSTLGHNDELLPYHKTTEFGSGYFDVDQLAPHMRRGLKEWGEWLTDTVGYQAYRFDLTQRIEPWYVWEWMHYGPMRGSFAVAEYWALADGREQQEWIDLTGHSVAVFDWNLQKMLKDMCEGNGSFDMKRLDHPSLLGLDPDYTVTFVESHDTYAPMKTLEEQGILLGKDLAYGYTLFQPSMTMVYYHDYYLQPYHDGTQNPSDPTRGWPTGYFGAPLKPWIDKGIWIRQTFLAGPATYLVTNAAVQGDLYIAVRNGGGRPGGMLAINDATSSRTTTVTTPWINTTLRDAYTNDSGTEVTTGVDGSVSLTIPGRTCRVYIPVSALP